MGLKSINETLKTHAPGAFGTISLTYFSGSRIALDGNEWIYSAVAVIVKNMIMSLVDPLQEIDREELIKKAVYSALNFASSIMKYNIILVWCWDGTAPAEKAYIREKRRASREKLRKRISDKRQILESAHVLKRTPAEILAYKKLLCQDTTVSPKEMDQIATILKSFGLPCVRAKGEGEKLASALAREGLVKAVWSDDTDNYALGTPLLIKGFGGIGSDRTQHVEIVSIEGLLQGMTTSLGWGDKGIRFGLANLIDMGILHGTDFNPNIYRVGPKKIFALIQKYGSIEYIAAYEQKLNTSVLNHVRSRELFEYEPSGYLHISKDLNVDKSISDSALLEMAEYHGCIDIIADFKSSVQYITDSPEKIQINPWVGVKGPQDYELKETAQSFCGDRTKEKEGDRTKEKEADRTKEKEGDCVREITKLPLPQEADSAVKIEATSKEDQEKSLSKDTLSVKMGINIKDSTTPQFTELKFEQTSTFTTFKTGDICGFSLQTAREEKNGLKGGKDSNTKVSLLETALNAGPVLNKGQPMPVAPSLQVITKIVEPPSSVATSSTLLGSPSVPSFSTIKEGNQENGDTHENTSKLGTLPQFA